MHGPLDSPRKPMSIINILLVCTLVVLSLIAACVGGGLLYWQSTVTAPKERAAPIVLDVPVQRCIVSPKANFLATINQMEDHVTFYRLNAHRATLLVFTPAVPAGISGFWLNDTTWFHNERISLSDTPPIQLAATPIEPGMGWLVDMVHDVITDVATLSPATRETVLRDAHAFSATSIERKTAAAISPDRRYIAHRGSIFQYDPVTNDRGALVNTLETRHSTDTCAFGWTPDSSGIYFIERGHTLGGSQPGPVRFLPINPTP
jgi:hypothetical protein